MSNHELLAILIHLLHTVICNAVLPMQPLQWCLVTLICLYCPTNLAHPGTKPTLPELLKFTCTDRTVLNISVEVATKFSQFGIFLLDDKNGSRIHNMVYKHHDHPERINTEILQEWLAGSGKQPVTWATLTKVLRDIELSTLAGEIEAVKCPETREPS